MDFAATAAFRRETWCSPKISWLAAGRLRSGFWAKASRLYCLWQVAASIFAAGVCGCLSFFGGVPVFFASSRDAAEKTGGRETIARLLKSSLEKSLGVVEEDWGVKKLGHQWYSHRWRRERKCVFFFLCRSQKNVISSRDDCFLRFSVLIEDVFKKYLKLFFKKLKSVKWRKKEDEKDDCRSYFFSSNSCNSSSTYFLNKDKV